MCVPMLQPQRHVHVHGSPSSLLAALCTLTVTVCVDTALAAHAPAALPAHPLPNVATHSVFRFSVAGHSSGGTMASNHFFAYSDRITGLGQIESGAYARDRAKLPADPASMAQQV